MIGKDFARLFVAVHLTSILYAVFPKTCQPKMLSGAFVCCEGRAELGVGGRCDDECLLSSPYFGRRFLERADDAYARAAVSPISPLEGSLKIRI